MAKRPSLNQAKQNWQQSDEYQSYQQDIDDDIFGALETAEQGGNSARIQELEAEIKRLKQQHNDIIKTGHGEMILWGWRANAAGLHQPEGGINPENFLQVMEVLFGFVRHIQVLIGDALNHFEALGYGDTKAIAEYFQYDPETLYKWKSITNKVEIPLRSGIVEAVPDGRTLGISHYELVQSLPESEQFDYLVRARREGWTVRELRDAINEDKKQAVLPSPPLPYDATDYTQLGKKLAKIRSRAGQLSRKEADKAFEYIEEMCDHLAEQQRLMNEARQDILKRIKAE